MGDGLRDAVHAEISTRAQSSPGKLFKPQAPKALHFTPKSLNPPDQQRSCLNGVR